DGKLVLQATGAGHQFGINGPGISPPQLVLLPVTASDRLRLRPDQTLPFPLHVHNPAVQPVNNVVVKLASDYPTVEVLTDSTTIASLSKGETADTGETIQVRFTAGEGYFAPT